MSEQKYIGVLTSGGDAPGMNAAIRAVVMAAATKGLQVKGIRKGFAGLLARDFIKLGERDVANIMQLGSTMLLSARCPEFKDPEKVREGVRICREENIVGIIVIGGDGSYRGARDLSVLHEADGDVVPCIGIPATIDNDIGSTEFALGYDTAVNTAMHMVDCIRDTITSHSRCNIIEVMGRTVGHIALQVAAATGAITVVSAETEPQYDQQRDLIGKIKAAQATGLENFIVVISEGFLRPFSHYKPEEHGGKTELEWRAGIMGDLARTVEQETGVETRTTILGHVLRGGSPTVNDRVLATRFGYHAVELLSKGVGNRVVGVKNGEVKDYDILEGLAMKQPFNYALFRETMEISK